MIRAVAFTCCGHAFRLPESWGHGACPVCLRPSVVQQAAPLEPDQWEADGVMFSDAYMPCEWAERKK